MVLEIIDTISIFILSILSLIAIMFFFLYVMDIAWNVVRALADRKRGFSYYFSKPGPEN